MASAHLGPESPRPLAVISESYQNRFKIPAMEEYDEFSFGEDYEEKMYKLIHKYLELDTTDKLCYVGDNKGSMALLLQEKFVILEPVTTVLPGTFHYAETESHKLVPIRIAHVGAEEYFRSLAEQNIKGPKTLFTKVILADVVRYFTIPHHVYENILKCLAPGGKILITHRAGSLSTLPYFKDALDRLQDNETPYMTIIKTLQSCNLDVEWELECLPIIMPKKKWFAMIRERFPPQMDQLSDYEIMSGVRELSEGIMKYPGDVVEFTDRLLFITACRTEHTSCIPSIQRHGVCDSLPPPSSTDLKLSMTLTPEVRKYLKQDKREKKMFNWS
ncbi:uncharacterized protein [Haliotis cracherodii]|uniref:uncharacterized protein n=1 Tax=Haliotis cracherodii TaxID=6455 RepID=UPI0039EA1ED3